MPSTNAALTFTPHPWEMTGLSLAPRYQVERGNYSLADLMLVKDANEAIRFYGIGR